MIWFFFFFNDTATTEIYTLSLHDALPIYERTFSVPRSVASNLGKKAIVQHGVDLNHNGRYDFKDRKSTRLNSSHANISYAVFCLKKKKQIGKAHVCNTVPTISRIPISACK